MRKLLLFLFTVFSIFAFAQTTDAAGKKQGYWKKRDDKNKLVYEGLFKDDKPVGKFKYYYPNDSVRAIMHFKADGKGAYVKLFHMTGKRMGEGKYSAMEIKDSVWTYYDEAGTLISRENYVAGKKEGQAFVYLPDGSVAEMRTYKNDIQDGPFKEYFSSNAIKAQGNYLNGHMEGRISYHFPNGTEVAAGFYKNGAKNGPWIYRTESGKVREKELYKNGKLASKKETDEFFAKSKTETKPAPQAPAQQKTAPKK